MRNCRGPEGRLAPGVSGIGRNCTRGTVSACWKRPTAQRSDTRERILEVAEAAVLAKGFAATSIDELIAAVGITKSGFFYHFKDKGELAKAMLLRYLEHDKALLDGLFRRADELNEDPLHGFLVGLKLFAEMMADLPEVHPGCLAASFAYQDQLFNRKFASSTPPACWPGARASASGSI